MADFDDIAQVYDSDFTYSEIGKKQRALAWEFFQQHYNDKVSGKTALLEMNCGTGEDALFFAKQGIFVTATDISREMLAVVEQKVQKADLQSHIFVQKWDLTQDFLLPNQYHVAFSNFGGWNCLTSENIENLGLKLSALLLPKGKLFVVVMPHFCIWESIYFLYRRKWKEIFRRSNKNAISAKLENVFVNTYYYSPSEIQKLLSPHFRMIDYQAIGICLPPSYLEKFFQKKPILLSFLDKIERILHKFRFSAFASDHFVMVLEK